jgi:hypothetical protein
MASPSDSSPHAAAAPSCSSLAMTISCPSFVMAMPSLRVSTTVSSPEQTGRRSSGDMEQQMEGRAEVGFQPDALALLLARLLAL